jgi:peptidyl-prolyl cis-trans isomerase SurA
MSRMLHWGILTTLLVIVLMFPFALQAELVDRIVATVNTEVITASELSCAVALNQRLGNADKDRLALEATTLDGLINRRLLVQEAHRLKFVEVTEQELSAEVEHVAKRFSSDKEFGDFLAALDMTRQDLARMLGEQLLVERFVEKKVGLFVRVTREEAESYFNEHAAEFKDKRFQDVQKMISALLTEKKMGLQLAQYLAEVRGRANIRISAR